MSGLVALSVSIGVLGAVATYLALGPLAGFLLIWAAFIGWGTFFSTGGDTAALKKTISCNVFGVVCAWVMAMLVLATPLSGLGTAGVAIAVGLTVLGLCLAAHISALDAIPASVFGYAATAGYLLQTPGALDADALTGASFGNALILVSVSMIVGALFGLASGKLAGVLTGSKKYSGGCEHIHTYSDSDPIDNHTCHCSVCKGVTGQDTTHVVFFNHNDLVVDHLDQLKRQPFNANNPDGPLELCTCSTCGTPIMLDDKENRIRVIVPNLMGYNTESLPATYHAFYDPSTGDSKPADGRPVYEGLRPDFVWPKSG